MTERQLDAAWFTYREVRRSQKFAKEQSRVARAAPLETVWFDDQLWNECVRAAMRL